MTGGSCARVIGLYPRPPQRLEVRLLRDDFRRGQVMKYRLSVRDNSGDLVPGGHVVKVTVTDPHGQCPARYSSALLCSGGSRIVSAKLADNAPVGTWMITAEDWLGNQTPTVEFDVR